MTWTAAASWRSQQEAQALWASQTGTATSETSLRQTFLCLNLTTGIRSLGYAEPKISK